MPTYYIDFEGGNDANAGTSFATRWKTITNGATAARIAAGDEIRIMASPEPTSIGSATWTGGGRPNVVNILSSTNATPIVITTSAAHGLVAGDYVSIASHTTNTNANGVWKVGTVPTSTTFQLLQIDGTNTSGNGVGGVSGNITRANNLVVKTATPLVQNIALCGGLGEKPAWTASANVTTLQNTSLWKEGNSAAQVDIAAGFTTGKAAYYTLPATLNLSAYQQVSFWIRQSSGTAMVANDIYLALCTDTIGDTIAHICNVPLIGTTGAWIPITVDLGTNLNSAIQSVAFYVVIDRGAQTFQIDNITANKAASSADSVTLSSLISKSNGTGDEAWYAIQSINQDVIMLTNRSTATSTSLDIRGYNGASETITTYKRESIRIGNVGNVNNIIQDSGNSNNFITFSGGWNRTDMSTQTGQTWYDGGIGVGTGLLASSRNFIRIGRINFCRFGTGIDIASSSASDIDITSAYATGCQVGIGYNNSLMSNMSAGNIWVNNNERGVTIAGYGNKITDVKSCENCSLTGIQFGISQNCFIETVIAGNTGTSINSSSIENNGVNCAINNLTSTNSQQASSIRIPSGTLSVNGGSSSNNLAGVQIMGGTVYLNNFNLNEAIELSAISSTGVLYSNRHDNTDNNSTIFQPNLGIVQQQTTTVDSPGTTAWRMSPTAIRAGSGSPVRLKIGTVVCAASSLVTVTARMQRNNTGLTMRLCCPGGQIDGVANDVTSDMTAAINTWETVTITFTPTKAGAVDIYAYAFGGTTFHGFVTNLTATQA